MAGDLSENLKNPYLFQENQAGEYEYSENDYGGKVASGSLALADEPGISVSPAERGISPLRGSPSRPLQWYAAQPNRPEAYMGYVIYETPEGNRDYDTFHMVNESQSEIASWEIKWPPSSAPHSLSLPRRISPPAAAWAALSRTGSSAKAREPEATFPP